MNNTKMLDEIFLKCLKSSHDLKDLGINFNFSELVALAAPYPECLVPDDLVAKAPAELYRFLEDLYYPFPVPVQQTTFFQLIRKNLQDYGFVRSMENSKTRSQRYLTTKMGRLQLQISTIELARPNENTTADHALFLVHSALQWKSVLSYVKQPMKVLDSFLGFLGMPDDTVETMLSMAVKPGTTARSIQKDFLKELEKVELAKEASDFRDYAKFYKFCNDALSRNATNLTFFKGGLEDYKKFFKERADKTEGINASADPIKAFAGKKSLAFSEMCSWALDIIKK